MINNCKFCLAEISGNYCSNCGKKIVIGFDEKSFSSIFNSISDHSNNFVSKDFKKVLEQYPFGFFSSKNRLLNVMLLTGYVIRISEERFGTSKKFSDTTIETIINKPNMAKIEKIKEVTDYIDSKNRLISLNGVDEKYLVNKDIVSMFNLITRQRFINFFEQSEKEGRKIKKGFDVEVAWEVACRHSVWGYLFRMIESGWF